MKNSLRPIGCILLVTLAILFHSSQVMATEDDDAILVGRISYVEGRLLRYIEEFKDWVVTVNDSPFALDDALYSEDGTKVEIIMPNQTWLRVGENSQIQLITLNSDTTTIDVASGLARFYNKSQDAVIKATTPFGYVVASAGTVFDLYVGDESLEIIAVRGSVDFVDEQSGSRYEVWEGSSSLIANGNETGQGNGMVASDWDDWNEERETIWDQRLRQSDSSANLLPVQIRDQAYTLVENGQWERISYEGAYRDMWRPTRVDPGWRPFTAGRWTLYYGDNCWIPDEPFGYITHHYGTWVFIESSARWFWMPPVANFYADAPRFSIGFGWYPGRVGWLHSGPSLGWVPLAPDENYYGYHHWGRRTVVINHNTVTHRNTDHYRYINEAVIIDREHFYRGSRYTPYIQHNISRDIIINNYRPTAVINTTIINNINIEKRRYTYNDIEIHRKPHNTVINRIEKNQHRERDFGRVGKDGIEKALMRVKAKANPSPKVDLHKPALSTRLVAAENIAKPFNSLKHEKRELKPQERQRPIAQGKGRQSEKGKGKEEPDRMRVTPSEKEHRQKVKAESPLSPSEEHVQSPDRTKFQQRQPLLPRQKERPQQEQPAQFDRNRQRPSGDAGATDGFNNLEESPRLKSPRTNVNVEEIRPIAKNVHPQGDKQGQRKSQLDRQQEAKEIKQQQEKIEQRQQKQEVRQQQQQKETQRQQKQEVQQRQQQKETQRQQEQEVRQQQQQKETQRQQKQEVQQQQQQKETQRQQKQEVQQRQQQKQKQQAQPDDSARRQEHAAKQKKKVEEELQQQKAQSPGGDS